MVKRLMSGLLLLAGCLIAAEEPPPPAAKDVLPSASALPGGRYRYPWDMGPNSAIKSEAEWHVQNPPAHTAIPTLAQALRDMPDEDWAETVRQIKQLAESGLMMPFGAGGHQEAMIQSVLTDGSKAAAAAALEASVKGMLDSAPMEYVRIENPGALQAATPTGAPPNLGGVVRLKVGIEIWDPAVISNRVDAMDVSPEEVKQLVSDSRKTFETATRLAVARWCKSLEDDLVRANQRTPTDAAMVKKALELMISASASKFTASGKPLGLGDNAHILMLYRAKLPDQPQVSQGMARVRLGRAVATITFEVADKLADEFEQELMKCLEVFVPRMAPFDLRLPAGAQP